MDKAKIFITTLTGVLSSILGVLYIPVLLMVSSSIIDYITGLIAAKYRADGKISSYKSIKGIYKKILTWLLVVVGALIDILIKYSTNQLGIKLQINFLVAGAVAIWIVCNECISILENIADTGVRIPKFIMPLLKNIKRQTEDNITISDENKEE